VVHLGKTQPFVRFVALTLSLLGLGLRGPYSRCRSHSHVPPLSAALRLGQDVLLWGIVKRQGENELNATMPGQHSRMTKSD